MTTKSEIIEKAMGIINGIILELNEKSLDRNRLSSKSRLAVIKKIDKLEEMDEETFQSTVKQIFREELMAEMVRMKK